MPARTFVLIFKCVARPNLCEPPALAKPPPRYRQVGQRSAIIKLKKWRIIDNDSERK